MLMIRRRRYVFIDQLFRCCLPYQQHHHVYSTIDDDSSTSTSPPPKRHPRSFSSPNPRSPAPQPPPSYYHAQYSGQSQFSFEVLHQSSKSSARVCRISTPHGPILTPSFVPVATNAALKAVDLVSLDSLIDLQLVFCNTYHLALHPGAHHVAAAGGLHSFINRRRDRPLITDSGGFQVFSLAYGTVHEELHASSSLKRRVPPGAGAVDGSGEGGGEATRRKKNNLVLKINEDGVTFRSYRDGTVMQLTPESSIHAQKQLGADIILPLDELPPYNITDARLLESLHRSHRWEARSLLAHASNPGSQACYGIIHGGSSPTLRRHSADFIASLPFDGFAVGGALGKDRNELFDIMRGVMGCIPSADRPVHVLGIADPLSVSPLVQLGCDTFDSCHATRVGRHGGMLTEQGTLRVGAGGNKTAYDCRPAVPGCSCPTCSTYSLAYLHHLIKAKEPIAATLLSIHNLAFMTRMMEKIRTEILEDRI